MAEYLLITGDKYNKNVHYVLALLLAIIFIGVMAVSGWSLQILPEPKVTVKELPVTQITADTLYQSQFLLPYMMNVLRQDGSYSFAKIENGVVMGGRLFGATQLNYQNGDSGLVEDKNGSIDIFVSKKGIKETVEIVERAVTGITLPDGQVLPVKVINGKILRGVLTGDFEMASLVDNSSILGKFDTRGNLVQVEVRPSIKEPNRISSLVGKELLKLYMEMETGKSGAVLAATTDEPVVSGEDTRIVGEAVGASFFRVTKDVVDGSLGVVSAAPATVTTAVTPSLSGDVTVNPVTGLTSIGGGVVTGGKIANGAISETQLANDAVVESRIKDGAVTSNKISDGTISDTDISGSAAISDGKLATISTVGKVAGSAVQLSTSGGLTNVSGLSLLTSCSNGQILQWNGSAWVCATVSGGGSGVSSLNSLTGGLTIAGGGINSVSVLGSTITVTGTVPSLNPTYFTTADISQWTNNAGYITDGNTNWDNSYGFITASSSDILTNKTISGLTNTVTNIGNTSLVNSSLTVTAGTGLSGGGLVSLGGSTTLSLPNVGTSGTYGGAASIPVITTDSQGRVTNVTPTAISGLGVSNFTSTNISQWTNNSGYITDGNTNWDNSYGFITASSSDILTNKTIAAGSNIITGLTNSNLSGTAGITDSNLAQITTADKVAGSAVQLNTNGGISNSTGLTLLTTCATNEILKWSGSVWACAADVSGGSPAFSGIASGTNTTAAMVVGTGASLNYSGTGTINASSLLGGTWASPGAIGSGTANSGAFTSLSSTGTTNLGQGTGVVTLNSSGALNFTAAAASTWTLANVTNSLNIDTNTLVVDALNNRVGVGNSAPSYGFSVVSTQPALNVAGITNLDTTNNNTSYSALRIGIGATTGNSARFVQFYSDVTTQTDGQGVGNIRLNNNGVTYASGNADVAEYFDINGSFATGDIIGMAAGGNRKAVAGDLLLGAVSTNPAFLGNDLASPGSGQGIVGILGMVNVNVNTSNGNIAVGDPIAVSATAGVGMKATKAGPILGKAMEAYSSGGTGSIKVSINPSWYDPDPLIPSGAASFTLSGQDVLDQYGAVVSRIGGFQGIITRDATISGTITLPNGAITNNNLANSSLTVSAGTGLSGGGLVSLGGTTTLSLPNVGTSGTYGGAASIPVITTDSQGRVTNVTPTAISGLTNLNLSGTAGITDANLAQLTTGNKVAGSAVQLNASGGLTNNAGLSLITTCSSGELLKWNGSAWACAADVSGGSPSLNTITAAAGANTLANADYAQTWNWALTTTAKTAFTFGETSAATNGAGSQYILGVSTLASSTAGPLKVAARGNTIIDTTSTGGITFGNTTANTAITLQSGTGNINIGTDANAKTITIGNSTGATALQLSSGTGGINIGTAAVAKSINIGTGAANQTVTIGSTNDGSTLTLNAGTGGIVGGGLLAQANGNYVVCYNTTTNVLYKGAARNNCDSSSLRFKHDIEGITLGLSAVNALRPVSYTYNDANYSNLGFIAEEAILIDDRLVNLDENGLPYSLNTDAFIPILTKGIQELDVKVVGQGLALTEDINTLTDQVMGIATAAGETKSEITVDGVAKQIADAITSTLNSVIEFAGRVIFRNNVSFLGRPTFNKDTAGFAIVKAGGNEVEVLFENEYADEPVVTVTAQITGGASVTDIPEYAVADVNTKGFKIRLSRVTGMDIRFAWMALAVANKTSFQGNGGEVTTPTIKVSPTPTPTEVVSPAATVEITLSPTPTIEITPTPTEIATSSATVEVSPEVTPPLTPTPTKVSIL